jgi:hypothetical protein
MLIMRVFLTVTLAVAALAQVGGPALGYLPDGGTLRAIYGSPAEGTIGPALNAGRKYTQVVASPTGSFALASADSGEVLILTAAADGARLQAVTVQGASAGNIQLSPNGSSALISEGGHMQVLGGLPVSAPVLRSLDTSSLGKASAVAVSDDGQWVACVFGGAVRGLGPASQIILLPAPAGVTALTFFHGTEDLALATASRIVKISDIGGAAAQSSIFGSADGPAPPESPMAIALTSDNAHIVVLEPSGGIAQVNLASGAVSTATCGCTARGLFGLGGFAFRLSSLAGGSVKVYDVQTSRVVTFALAAPDRSWKDKQFSEWTEDDAKEVIANSPWVKKVTPTVAVKTPEPDKQARPGGVRHRGGIDIGGIGRRSGGSPTGDDQRSPPAVAEPPPTPVPALTLRWESALPMREAERKARETGAPAVDEHHYAIAVYGIPRTMVANDSKELAGELKKHAILKRDAKDDLRPSSVKILLREDGPVIVYLFPKSPEITWRDPRVQFDAHVAKLDISQSFATADMRFHGDFEL